MRCQPIKPIGTNISFIHRDKPAPVDTKKTKVPTDDTTKIQPGKNNDR